MQVTLCYLALPAPAGVAAASEFLPPARGAGEVGVLRRGHEAAPGRRRDDHSRRCPRAVDPDNSTRREASAAVPRENLLAHHDRLDCLLRSVSHRHERALDEALVGIANREDAPVLCRQELVEAVLCVVRVLLLVDEDVA